MKVIDLLIKKANNELMPKLIKITWLDYEVKYYLDDNFWYRSIEDDKKLEILGNILNIEVEVITNEYRQLVQKDEIIEEDKKIEEILIQSNRKVTYRKDKFIEGMLDHFYDLDLEVREKLNELIREINKLKKEGK